MTVKFTVTIEEGSNRMNYEMVGSGYCTKAEAESVKRVQAAILRELESQPGFQLNDSSVESSHR